MPIPQDSDNDNSMNLVDMAVDDDAIDETMRNGNISHDNTPC